jgi:nicotinate dehydrogenase subunit B
MKMRWRVLLTGLAVAVVAAGAGFAAISYRPAIAPVGKPLAASFPLDLVARGTELAAVGDCAVCHTAPGGPRLAGGRGVPTPFGTVYATNITPDPDTGIGAWSEAAFTRAMRDGIARDGSHLYPVLPYPHFTRATDADISAVYAYLMTRNPVRAEPPPNQLPFPLNQRFVLAGWNLLFLHPGPWQPDPAQNAAWNRGAYLVEAVGHCGACHTPHNVLGAEENRDYLAGGEAEGWYAPPLQANSPARVAWTQAQLAAYLRTGFAAQHGAAAGPMTAVTEELAAVPDADVAAMATYIASFMPKPAAEVAAMTPGGGSEAGRTLFAGACAACHAPTAPMTRDGAPSLAMTSALNANTPQSAIQAILHGIPWREGKPAPYMPAFEAALTDGQIAELVTYLRANYSSAPAWNGVADAVTKARKSGGAT